MKFKIYISIVLLIIILSIVNAESRQQYAYLKNFKLENGKIIQNCCIGYRIVGKLNKDKSNIVLFPTWFGGISAHLEKLVGPGKLIDSNKFCVIIVDALGNGISSSPSDYRNPFNFPVYSIYDMVKTQYILLTKKLGINHLHAIVGGSMGGMQAFEWVVAYPDFVDRAVPYVSTPRLSSYELLVMHTMLHIIETSQKYKCPDKEILKSMDMTFTFLARSPENIVKNIKYDKFYDFLKTFDNHVKSSFTVNNFASQVRAMLKHNIFRNYNNSMKETAKAIKSKLFIIVCKQDHLVHAKTALNFSKAVNAKTMVLDNDMGHLAVGAELKKVAKEIDKFLEK